MRQEEQEVQIMKQSFLTMVDDDFDEADKYKDEQSSSYEQNQL